MSIDETVPAALAGERLDRLVALLADLTRSEASSLLAAGGVTLNGEPAAKGSARVATGDRLHIDAPDRAAQLLPEADPGVGFTVVHADPHVVVVDKPAGLVVHPGAGNPAGTLVNGLLARFPDVAGVGGDPDRPGIVHRLDKGTSGLLVVARTPQAYEGLVAMLTERRVERRYRTLVWGHPDADRGIVDAPIGRSDREPTKMAVTAAGRGARTGYEVVGTYTSPADLAQLVCTLETGRTHQIRVHLAAIGHPVVGDERYGPSHREVALARPFLHAAELAFCHPVTGEQLRFTSRLPADLEAVLVGLD